MDSMFLGCIFLEYIDLSNFNTYKVIDMSFMFSLCIQLKQIKGINNFKFF